MISPIALVVRRWFIRTLFGLGLMAVSVLAEDAALRVDFGKSAGKIRPLHGLNKGPLASGGLIDLTTSIQALHPPYVRLHDCHWPNPDVVDIHAVFPDFGADASLAGSYHFALTDEYIAATRKTGAEIVFRLGESIEHTSTKRFVHPPKDYEKWAAIVLGIIRHYNEGWAGGAHHNIRYWEIWNEPENRPAMWSGSDEDYFRLYRVTSRSMKRHFPHLKVGGPSAGYSGDWVEGAFRPGAFVTNFLAFCRGESLPLDFFSWHCYTADPAELTGRARAIRGLLDDYGFRGSESHLNEWNYLPGNTWKPISRSSSPEARQSYYEQMAGAPGAAFITVALLELQDSPVDVCNLFHGELGGFGLFNEHGVPQKNYHALRAFSELVEMRGRVETQGSMPGKLALVAGVKQDHSAAAVLLGSLAGTPGRRPVAFTNLPWTGATVAEIGRINSEENFDVYIRHTNAPGNFTLELELSSPSVVMVRLRPLQTRP